MPVRKAAPADVQAICELINSNLDNLLPRSKEEIADLVESFFVAEEEGEVLGCVCLEVYSQKIAELRSLAVSEKARGKGYGKLLVDAVLAEAEVREIPEVLAVTSALEFFQQMNFKGVLNEKYALFWNRAKG